MPGLGKGRREEEMANGSSYNLISKKSQSPPAIPLLFQPSFSFYCGFFGVCNADVHIE